MGEISYISTTNPFLRNNHVDRLEVLRIGKQIVNILQGGKGSRCVVVDGFPEDFLQNSGSYISELAGAVTQECCRLKISCEIDIPAQESLITLEHSIFKIPIFIFGSFYNLRVSAENISADGDRGSNLVVVHISRASSIRRIAGKLWKSWKKFLLSRRSS